MIKNSLLHRTINAEIIKLDISDHFPIFLTAKAERKMAPEGKLQITKHLINNKIKKKFKDALQEMRWNDVKRSTLIGSAYEAFFNKSTSLYDKTFEKFVVTLC